MSKLDNERMRFCSIFKLTSQINLLKYPHVLELS